MQVVWAPDTRTHLLAPVVLGTLWLPSCVLCSPNTPLGLGNNAACQSSGHVLIHLPLLCCRVLTSSMEFYSLTRQLNRCVQPCALHGRSPLAFWLCAVTPHGYAHGRAVRCSAPVAACMLQHNTLTIPFKCSGTGCILHCYAPTSNFRSEPCPARHLWPCSPLIERAAAPQRSSHVCPTIRPSAVLSDALPFPFEAPLPPHCSFCRRLTLPPLCPSG